MWASKQRGMTLPEILIVLILLAGTFSLVGPLTVESLAKRQHRFEQLQLGIDLRFFQSQAKWKNKSLELTFSGKQLIVKETLGKPIEVKKFDELNFTKQTLRINASGLASSCELALTTTDSKIKVLEELCITKSESADSP